MRVRTFGTALAQLTRFPRLFPVNCYLVREDDGFTLVDAAIGGSAPAIIAAAAQLGAHIVRIAITHAHADHVGALDELHRRLPAAEILVSARDARFLAGDMRLDPAEPPAKLRGAYVEVKIRPTRLLQPGDRVGSLQVVATPGHTPGHIAFLDTRDGVVIAGDALQTRGGVAVAGTLRPLFPFPALATWHRPSALQSAVALRELRPSRLAVGHGEVLTDPIPALNRAIAAAERALAAEVAHGA